MFAIITVGNKIPTSNNPDMAAELWKLNKNTTKINIFQNKFLL